MYRSLVRPAMAATGVFIAFAVLAAASDLPLAAAPLALLLHLPFGAPTVAVAEPSPLPSVGIVPEPVPHGFLGAGPITLRGAGSFQLGFNRTAETGADLTNDYYGSSLALTVDRRTERTTTTISNAFGYSAGQFAASSLFVGYHTPQYGLSYGQVAGPSDTLLQIGGVARGVSLTVPQRLGALDVIAATAEQADRTTYRIAGVRRAWSGAHTTVYAAQYLSAGEGVPGRQAISDLGYKVFSGDFSAAAEAGLSTTRGLGFIEDGQHLSAALHVDYRQRHTFNSLDLRDDPSGFPTLTNVLDPGRSIEYAVRRQFARFGDVAADIAHVDRTTSGLAEHENRVTLSGGRNWAHFGVLYVAGVDRVQEDSGVTLQRQGALTFNQTAARLASFSETYQVSSSGGSGGGASQTQFVVSASVPAFGGTAGYQASRTTSASDGGGSGSGILHALAFRHAVGAKLDLQLTETLQHSENAGEASTLVASGVALTRRFSSVVALQAGASFFRQSGIGATSGVAFSASILGPFSFGRPKETFGGGNPKLPAVIRGIVIAAGNANPAVGGNPALHGIANALVILDGRFSQRTDANGEFSFRFVPQGTHALRLDAASLGPGLIVDRGTLDVDVLGGQTATVQFNVGNFAGVAGFVAARRADGSLRPIPDVGIAIDGIQTVRTGSDGRYDIGRLVTGTHTVELVETTIPANLGFAERKRIVSVTPGIAVPIDFTGTALGAIGGRVVAPPESGNGPPAGLADAYVVAEPGGFAAITADDGSFLLDGLPPGSYTIGIDPETLPPGSVVSGGPAGPVAVEAGSAVSGLRFVVGEAPKDVVVTFNGPGASPIDLVIEPASPVPPGAQLRITARSPVRDLAVLAFESDELGKVNLHHDAVSGNWTGTLVVPTVARGSYAVHAVAHRPEVADASAAVEVDPRVPLISLRTQPAHPAAGRTIRVLLTTLAPAEPGDAIVFEDGYRIVLPRPTGRTFAFDMRMWRNGAPYAGRLITRTGQTYPLAIR